MRDRLESFKIRTTFNTVLYSPLYTKSQQFTTSLYQILASYSKMFLRTAKMFLRTAKKGMINIIWIMNDLKFTNGSVSEVVKGMKIEKQSLI